MSLGIPLFATVEIFGGGEAAEVEGKIDRAMKRRIAGENFMVGQEAVLDA
jgi:hypothetical protein